MNDKAESEGQPILRSAPKGIPFFVLVAIVVAFYWLAKYLVDQIALDLLQTFAAIQEWGGDVAPKLAYLFDFDEVHRVYAFFYQQPYPTGTRFQDALQAQPHLWLWGIGMSCALLLTALSVIATSVGIIDFFVAKAAVMLREVWGA